MDVLVLIDEYIHWYNHARIRHQTVARLDEPGTIPSEPRNGCVIISKKRPQPPTGIDKHEGEKVSGFDTVLTRQEFEEM